MTVEHTEPQSKPKEKSPAFQFYPKDVLSDGNAMAMPLEAFGAYMLMLCFDWIDNGVVDDAKAVRRLCGYEPYNFQGDQRDIEDWDIIYSYVRNQFDSHPTKEGYITNPRLLKERQKQTERSEIAKQNADKRWEKEGQSLDATALGSHESGICKPNAKRCSSSSTPSSSSNNLYIHTDTPKIPQKLDNPDCHKALAHWAKHYKKVKKAEFDAIQAEALLISYADRPEDFIWDILKSSQNGWHNIRDCSHLKAKKTEYRNGSYQTKNESPHPMSGVKEFKAATTSKPRVPNDAETQAKLDALTKTIANKLPVMS